MKVYLDDERATPDGWIRCYWPDEVIELLYSGDVTEISLDHDLGDDKRGTGYDVLVWIEEAVADRGWCPPAMSVHSANSSARQKMEAAIRQIHKLADLQFDHTKHREDGKFLQDWDGEKPAWFVPEFVPEAGEPILLEGSAEMSVFFELEDDIIIGADNGWKCYRDEFRDAGWRRPLTPQPIAIWDARTGSRTRFLQGHHFGEVKGAELLDDGRLITWGRDYLIRVWDRVSGACTDVLPLPLWPDPEKRQALLSCQAFAEIKRSEKQRYVDTRHLPAPDVKIDWIVKPGEFQHSYSCVVETRAEQNMVKPWTPNADEPGPHRIQDLDGAEAGYSTWFIMTDGRLLGGGTTYGTSGIFYVWDGFFGLQSLISGNRGSDLHLLGEVEPNVIGIENIADMDCNNQYRFKL